VKKRKKERLADLFTPGNCLRDEKESISNKAGSGSLGYLILPLI
jgi:hypothetical protein